ncbi:hypothetical protein PM082_020153 [Marasmius tenuissimus]|nr:hypothetical protein PM082_020153 [Marasmius tenuissimus]
MLAHVEPHHLTLRARGHDYSERRDLGIASAENRIEGKLTHNRLSFRLVSFVAAVARSCGSATIPRQTKFYEGIETLCLANHPLGSAASGLVTSTFSLGFPSTLLPWRRREARAQRNTASFAVIGSPRRYGITVIYGCFVEVDGWDIDTIQLGYPTISTLSRITRTRPLATLSRRYCTTLPPGILTHLLPPSLVKPASFTTYKACRWAARVTSNMLFLGKIESWRDASKRFGVSELNDRTRTMRSFSNPHLQLRTTKPCHST